MKSSFCIDLQRFMLIPTKFPLSPKTGKKDWTADDVADWGTTNLSVTDKTALVLEGKGNISASHDFTFASNDPLVTLVAEFKAGTNCDNAESYNYFTFGGITFKFNRVDDKSGYFKLVADGEETTLAGKPESKMYTITIVVNQAEDEAYYKLAYKNDEIASGIVETSTPLSSVEFGHHATDQTDENTLILQSLVIKENPGVKLDLSKSYNKYKYSTFCSPDHDVDFTDVTVVKAYQASVNNNVVTLTQVTGKVKAGEGLLIENVDNVQSVSLPVVHDAEALLNNCLKGVTKNMTKSDFVDKTAYILYSDEEFRYIDPVNSEKTLQKGKAYLELPKTSAKPSTLFIGEATAINGIAVEKKADNAIYNLQGMRVKTPTKGLYIINGKKYRF